MSKKFILILLCLMFLIIGVEIGGIEANNQADIIKNQIADFEENIKDGNIQTYDDLQNIEPTVINKAGKGLETLVNQVFEKVLGIF